MDNIALNKPASASNTVAPFGAALAVDGVSNNPRNRWLATATILPGGAYAPVWMQVDLQGNYWVGQYSMSFPSAAGWPAQYSVNDFKIQSSLDGANWLDRDSVINNTASSIQNKQIAPALARYLRVYITKGLAVSNGVASIMDFQASEAANAPLLSSLVSSAGATNTAFSSRNFAYTINVDSSTASIAFTPTAVNAAVMTIKVNGTTVASGQASQSISLNPGNNTVTIEVATTNTAMKSTYTVTVVKAAAAAYLSGIAVKNNRNNDVLLTPSPFVKETLNYTASVASSITSVTVQPTALNSTSVVKVNNVVVPNGQPSSPITMNTGLNTVTILVDSITTYTVGITKA
jgi:hypothetical protein